MGANPITSQVTTTKGATMTTAVSLFAGVGGFDLALERAGVKVVATVEWDKHAQKVLQRRFPNAALFGDIQGVTGEQLRAAGFNPSNGIITGGFPCQDLSVAGKRAGLAGTRSGLFWEICRLLDETRTQTFILENVPGLLSSNNGRDMAVVIEALVKRGYRIAWRVLDAQYFGVPQRRRRVFIVGCLGETGRSPEEILALAQGRAGYLAKSNAKGKDASTGVTTSAGIGGAVGNFELYDFPDESVSPTLSSQRAHDTMTWWDGSDIADTITRTSSEQRMPDKNRFQAVITDVVR
jgi:DNA (cytosine-5)-methyltransferase 1